MDQNYSDKCDSGHVHRWTVRAGRDRLYVAEYTIDGYAPVLYSPLPECCGDVHYGVLAHYSTAAV